MKRTPRLKPTEFGGSDTQDTLGIQPAPHKLTTDERLRVIYSSDPFDLETPPIPGLLVDE